MNYTMEFNGFKAQIMEAERLKGEREHELPPGSSLPIYSVHEFKKHPDNWMEEDGCFVVPVKPNKGLWFDWRDNSGLNTAIVPTVKGCNPITGLKTEGFALERYEKKCPKHNTKFKADRYCEDCGYKWPAQNYVAQPNISWWDGFLDTASGTVRQFFITEDMMRDIASHKIGKENTVPAFGFAFYKTKVEKEMPMEMPIINWEPYIHHFVPPTHYFGCNCSGCGCHNYWHTNVFGLTVGGTPDLDMSPNVSYTSSNNLKGSVTLDSLESSEPQSVYLNHVETGKSSKANYSADEIEHVNLEDMPVRLRSRGIDEAQINKFMKSAPKKEVAVGAGAKIKQALQPDTYKLDEWKDEPSSIMRIYFVFEEEFKHWKSFGMKDLYGTRDGMLNGLPVG